MKTEKNKCLRWVQNEVYCMDLASVDKLATHNNGEKYPLFREDLFD